MTCYSNPKNETYLRPNRICGVAGGASENKERILETVSELNRILDVEEPWVLVMFDPSGVSEIKPEALVSLERYDPKTED